MSFDLAGVRTIAPNGRQLPPQKFSLEDNCPADNRPRGKLLDDYSWMMDDASWLITPGKLPQRKLPSDNIPLEIAPECLSDDLSPGTLSQV